MRLIRPILFFLLGICGCQNVAKSPNPQAPASHPFEAIAKPSPTHPAAAPRVLHLVQLDVYQLEVPFGSISNDTEFWRRIDTDGIDPSVQRTLLKDGFRVGQGLIYDWPFFREIIDQHPVSTWVTSRIAYSERQEQLLVKKNQLPRNIFYFNTAGNLVGRSFDFADYELMLSFWPTPRNNGQIHVQLVPVIQPHRQILEHYELDGRDAVRIVRPKFFYDLKLESDLSVDHFLIVAPSTTSDLESSLGNAFLVNPGPAARTETILIFVARPIGGTSLLPNQK